MNRATMSLRRFYFWTDWSIWQRLLLITLLPVLYLFCMLIWHSYWSHGREVDIEINERGKIISQLLAKSSEFELAEHRLPELRLSLDNLIESESSIYSIDILDAQRATVLRSASRNQNQQHLRGFETPIVKHLVWVNVITGAGAERQAPANAANTQIVGYVVVVMSPSELQNKQRHRFTLELLVAGLGLLISGAMAVHLSRNLSLSLKTFIEACRAIRLGQYPVQIAVQSGGEIGELQESINDMAHSLQQSTHELEARVAQRTAELEQSRNEAVQANDEKRKLIHKVQHIVEEERKSIAIEVHDELNAALIAARLQAQRINALAATLPDSPQSAEIAQHAQSISQITRTLYDSGRALVRRLRPEVLDMLGLQGAVAEMVASYNGAHGSCHFSCRVNGDFSNLDNAAAMSLYRIIQEALSNSIKHADAREASVELTIDAKTNCVQLQIVDDGKGFVAQHGSDGIGLVGMRERVFALGGTIRIESGAESMPTAGTRISIRFETLPFKR